MENLNMNLHERVVIDLAQTPWLRSPGGEVERRMIERQHAESGHTTSVVRYPPDAAFPPHNHPGGEEFLVLEGVFSDEHGNYPPGSYLRNPIGFEHAPFSKEGCTIFVKLCQMRAGEERVVRQPDAHQWAPHGHGLSVAHLHVDDHERVDLMRAEQTVRLGLSNAELLVIEGAVVLDGDRMLAPVWLRIPSGPLCELELVEGSRVWRKRGHLPE